MNTPYLFYNGLQQLASDIIGNERIHLGIRPFSFHAGNAVAMMIYPYLLCEELTRIGKTPQLEFFVSINDFEQDVLSGPDLHAYPFNIYPQFTSLEFARDPIRDFIFTDYWQPIIERCVLETKKHFPRINFRFIRNSALKNNPEFKRLLLDTIQHPQEHADILRKLTGKIVLENPLTFAGALCPQCTAAQGKTSILYDEQISWSCDHCNYQAIGSYSTFSYWWYHKPLLVARLKIYGIDIALSGGDHFNEGDVEIRRAFIKRYYPDMDVPKMLFSPVVIADNGLKMSKSKKNMQFGLVRTLLEDIRGWNIQDFPIEERHIDRLATDENYSPFF